MIFTFPTALLGLSSLSFAVPTDGNRPVEPTDWVSEPLHEAPISSMKIHHVPLFQCNSYHSPVEARAGKYTVWKFCNDNERDSVYIHETTPYARRDDIEISAKECKTHKAASDKHKSFQVCNRGLHALKLQNLKIVSLVTVEDDQKDIKNVPEKEINPKPVVTHEEVKPVEVKNDPKTVKVDDHRLEKSHEVKAANPHGNFEEKHEIKHEEKHEFKHEEKHEVKKGDKHEDQHEDQHGHRHDEPKEEKHVVNHEEKHDKLKHEEKHVVKSGDKLHQAYPKDSRVAGNVAKRSSWWFNREARKEFWDKHGAGRHEREFVNGKVVSHVRKREPIFIEKHEDFRERERLPKEHHSKNGKYHNNHRDHGHVELHNHGLSDSELHSHILPRQIPGDEGFRGSGLEFDREREHGRIEAIRKHQLLDHLDREQFAKHHHKEKGHKQHEHHEEHKDHHPIEAHHQDHLDILHKDHQQERKHKQHKGDGHQRQHQHKHHEEEHHHPLDVLHKGPLEHLHHHNERNRYKKHHQRNRHNKNIHEEHHHLDLLHKDPLEHLHHSNEEDRHNKHRHNNHRHHNHRHHEHKHHQNNNNQHDGHHRLLEGLQGGPHHFEGGAFGREGFA
ncbi:hypothetical protein OIDMADRAFT_50290 [Oidiodendron maius Zn]|uniref:Ricin B lectin domain-containing protein n=1 Tax=Oidiodendron maius (strain Zn) TaxID=913774 RepID=A0A0C3HN20_OIDMZ|nr:hypothetical protein OIDMADRAFT_50290 [Oidiodendron maius Zn]